MNSQASYSRRQVLGLLGAGAIGSTGISKTANAQEQETPVVSMGNTDFDPIGLHVEPGTTVRFEIEAGSHSATAYEGRIPAAGTPFDSGVHSQGRFEHTFEVPGTYDYYCIPHESMGMVGRIVVGEPGGPAEDTSIPAGAVPDSEAIIEQGAITVDEFDGSSANRDNRMMKSGMINGGGPGWMVLMPLGFVSVLVGAVCAVVYWASRRGTPRAVGEGAALSTLREKYARGDIDEDEFQRRRNHLETET
ncbi:copper-binding protein [Halobacteriales archaeon QS_1_69_70]|nr:MAG: copper-binding protein [Halobacteriales archaeon QS_1_69_70]